MLIDIFWYKVDSNPDLNTATQRRKQRGLLTEQGAQNPKKSLKAKLKGSCIIGQEYLKTHDGEINIKTGNKAQQKRKEKKLQCPDRECTCPIQC